MRRRAFALLVAWLGMAGVAHDDAIVRFVAPKPSVASAPADIRVEVWVRRHRHHRRLIVAWDSEAEGGAFEAQVDGAAGPALYTRLVRGLGAGDYEFTAVVVDRDGRHVGTAWTRLLVR